MSVIVSYKTVTPTRLSVYPMSAYFLENNQLKICQRNILEWQILLPYEWKKGRFSCFTCIMETATRIVCLREIL